MPSGKQSLFSAERPEAFLRPEGYPARTVVATSRVLFAAMVLLSVAACSKVDGAWEEAMRTDTPDAYESFITKHPDSKQAELARTRRDALVDDRDWNVARRRATADAYSAYLEVHPEGVWSELAARRRAALPKQAPATAPATAADEPAVGDPSSVVPEASKPLMHTMQLGAFSSAKAARSSWGRLQLAYTELAELQPLIDATPLEGSSLFRLRIGFESKEDAERVCAALRRGGAECIRSETSRQR